MALTADDTPYLVWSNEHRGWWKGNRHGYTRSLAEAGRFSEREAILICVKAITGTADAIGMLPELPVRVADMRLIDNLYDDRGVAQAWR